MECGGKHISAKLAIKNAEYSIAERSSENGNAVPGNQQLTGKNQEFNSGRGGGDQKQFPWRRTH